MLRSALLCLVTSGLLITLTGHTQTPQSPIVAAPGCQSAAGITPICAVQAPEDLELLPDAEHIIVSQLPQGRDLSKGGGLALLDVATDTVQPLPTSAAFQPGWGDPSCTVAPKRLGSHGIHLSRRKDGTLQLLVVNHIARESIEFYEIRQNDGGPSAIWHGCVTNPTGVFNDVAGTPEGGFVATVSFDKALLALPDGLQIATSGAVTGYLVAWTPGSVLSRLPGSDAPFSNGIQLSPDGRYAYFNAWTGRRIVRYDLREHRSTAQVEVPFYPDNLSVRTDGLLLATGINELSSWKSCMAAQSTFCATGFSVAVFDPAAMTAKLLYQTPPGIMPGASVALQVKQTLYIGSYMGDRLVKVDLNTATSGQ